MPEDTTNTEEQGDDTTLPNEEEHYDNYEQEKEDAITGGMTGDNDG